MRAEVNQWRAARQTAQSLAISAFAHAAKLALALRLGDGEHTAQKLFVRGGELLLAALATCYCNDLYREAGKTGIEVLSVEVECGAEFPAEGAPASDVRYAARIHAKASEAQIRELADRADAAAEIQNTVRAAIPVRLETVTAAAERASD